MRRKPDGPCANSFRQVWINDFETPAFTRESQYGPIVQHQGGPNNLTGRFVKAYDVQTRYRFDATRIPLIGGNYGQFVVSVNATYNQDFIFQPGPGEPLVNGVGDRNDTLGRVPMPRLRMNGSLRWMYGNHTLRWSTTYHSEVDDLTSTGGIPFANIDGKIDAQAISSVFYQYRLEWLDSPTFISLSLYNVLNDRPKPLTDSSGIDPVLSGRSNLGRAWTFRIEQEI